MRFDSSAKGSGQYAMWWQSDDDPVFHTSKTCDYLIKMYEVFKGYETYLTGYVLRQTRVVQELELKRMQLPDNHATYIITAPEGKNVVLDISKEKGIRFLFPIDSTTKEYRERFLGGALVCLLYTSPSPRDATLSRMPSSA